MVPTGPCKTPPRHLRRGTSHPWPTTRPTATQFSSAAACRGSASPPPGAWGGPTRPLKPPARAPPTRHFASRAYAPANGNTVLFGGSMPGVPLNDPWTWDGTTWTKQTAAPPAASGWSYMTYDPAVKQIVAFVYFGLDNHGPAGYTITWDGSRWTDRTNASQPSPRADVGMAYDQVTRQVVLYGGTFDHPQPFAAPWVWDGSTWSLWSPAAGA